MFPSSSPFTRWLLGMVVLALWLPLGAAAAAREPVLEIATGGQVRQLTRNELLASPALREIRISADVAYRRPMRYRALPLRALIPDLPPTGNLRFIASDGFAATVPVSLLAGVGDPWLAVETADRPWPPLKPGGPGAGPFYLVWRAPAKGGVSPEQWPYQIARIDVVAPLQQRFPQILPRSADARVLRGLAVYERNCAACHRINGGGDAAIGPDLNLPHNPTEYFGDAWLRRLIRDPASVRDWQGRRMPGFPASVLDEPALDSLVAYLRQMAAQR